MSDNTDTTDPTVRPTTEDVAAGLNRRAFLATTAAGAGVTTLAGCLGDSDDDTISLGALYIFSGFASLYGEEAQRGFGLAVEEINENGGIDGQEVEVISRDTEADTDAGIRQMRSLIEEDGVDGLFGLDSSGVAQGMAPQIEAEAIPMMVTHAATPFLTSPTGEHENSVGNEWVFRNSVDLSINMYGAAQVAAELDADEWATIGADYAFGYETWDYFRAFCEGLGVDAEFIEEQYPALGTSDYTPYINSVLNAEPDAVITPLWGADLTTFLGQADEAGWFDEVDFTLMTTGLGAELTTEGPLMPEGDYGATRYDPFVPDTEANNTFRETYVDEYGRLPNYNAEGAYRAVYLYKEAIEEAGTDSEAIRDAFADLQHEGPVGEYEFAENTNQATLPALWGEVGASDEWDDNILDPAVAYEVTSEEMQDTLDAAGSDLPPGL